MLGSSQHGHRSALHLGWGHPACGAGARTVSIWPVRNPSVIFSSAPFHSVATMNSVLLSAPPSIQAKHPRSSSIVWSTSPHSRTRTKSLLPTSAYLLDIFTVDKATRNKLDRLWLTVLIDAY